MLRSMFRNKLHRVRVTEADVDYEGSVTIDADLMDAADILQHEEVRVWNVTRGTRFETYAMVGARGSGVICINGAAAHLAQPGDLVIIATFSPMSDDAARAHRPRVVFVDGDNRVRETRQETVG